MKVGILNAIPPKSSKVNWQGSPIDAYIRYFNTTQNGGSLHFIGYEITEGEWPASPDICDAYVVTGSPKGVYDEDEWIPQLMQFIRDSYNAGKKLIGICFGHQILAHALGGYAAKSAKGWGLGLNTIELNNDKTKPWLNGSSSECALYFVHQDQVMQLPPNAEHLGGNEFCPNAFFTIGDQVLGIQGHPEFSKQIMDEIVSSKLPGIDELAYETAVNSINNGTPDNQQIAQWMVNFLRLELSPEPQSSAPTP